MPPVITIQADVLDALAKAKLTNLDIKANKLSTKKIVMKADLQGNAISNTYKLADAQGKVVTLNERWTKSGKQVTTVTQEMGKTAEKTNKAFTMMNAIFLRLAHTALSAVTKAFKSALTEMKNVDTELTTISRITQTSISDLDALKQKAYEVGSAYGVLASDYLSAAAAFTRAGYREQAEDLAKLSSKMQIAGQVSAEVANQLLIATDKAYGFNGSVTELSSVMDKMTIIDHNYATSVEKIAEGMGLVAPIAKQAHMTTDELIASLGTITAVTQRSGSESARALRALILSIIKDTTTEIEDGVTWTVEEINSLQDALKLYAPEVVKAAEATGKLIDPMEAIAALSKAYEEGLLTEAKLADITSKLGGKLRASQLLSLIQNYSGMYTQMMQDMGNAIGAVDKDVDKALQSWDAKLNQLKNTFAGFAESLLDTDAIKGFIDAFRFLIEAIDNPEEYTGKFISAIEKSIESLVSKLPRFQEAINHVAVSIVRAFLSSLSSQMPTILHALAEGAQEATEDLSSHLPEITRSLFQTIAEIIGSSIADSGLALEITYSLVSGIIEALPSVLEGSVVGLATPFINAFSNSFSDEKTWFQVLSSFAKKNSGFFGRFLIEHLIEPELEKKSKEAAKKVGNAIEDGLESIDAKVEVFADVEEDTVELSKATGGAEESFKSLSGEIKEATDALDAYNKKLKDSGEKGDALKSYSEAYKKAVEMYEKGLTGSNQYMSAVDLLFGEVDDYEKAGELLGNAFVKAMFEGGGEDYGANAANYIKKHIDEFEGVQITEGENGTFGLMVTDMEKFAESTGLTADALWTLIDALDIFDSKTTYTRDQLFNFMGLEDDGAEKFVNLTALINDLAGQGKSAKEIKDIVEAVKELAETDGNITISEPENLDQTIKDVVELNKEAEKDKDMEVVLTSNSEEFFDGIRKEIDQINGTTIYIGIRTKNSRFGLNEGLGSEAAGTRSARGGLSLVNEEGAELIYANGKAWIAGGGDPTITNLPAGAGVFNARETREILARSGIESHDGRKGASVSGIPPFTSGGSGKSGKGKLTQSLLDQIADYINDILKKAKEALQEQLDAIDEQIDKLKREHDAEEDANKLEELRLKILEAEKKLAEAENERTVRYFNKETGQWEWMADQKAVAEAQKALQDARDAYDKEVAEQAYQAQIQALQDQKEALNKAYEDLEGNWEKILEELGKAVNGNNTVNIEALLKKLLGTKGGSYAPDIKAILEAIAAFTANPTSVLDEATTAQIMSAQSSTSGGASSVLSALLGSSSYDLNSHGQSVFGGSSTIVGDTIYYINGVHIGSDMVDKPLSQILSVLPIYAN